MFIFPLKFEISFLSKNAMKVTSRFSITFLTLTAGALALAGWSAHIGRKVWSPRVFAWRNPFKPRPIIEEQENCPVRLVRSRFYSFMSIGSSIGSVLKVDVENLSNKPIHSFNISYHSSVQSDTGSGGWQFETHLQPKQFYTIGTSSTGNDRVTFSVDFIQFADGDVWFANPPKETVKPEGVRAGEQAATEYLHEVLEIDGVAAVMRVLPKIRSKMGIWKFSTEGDFGHVGFNCGIKKAVVSVEHAHRENGLSEVEKFLKSYH
jgi:hypothetical protein